MKHELRQPRPTHPPTGVGEALVLAGQRQVLGELVDQQPGHESHLGTAAFAQMTGLYWDRTGFCGWTKLLERGRFVSDWARVMSREMDWTGLKLLLDGIEPNVVRSAIGIPQL